MVVVNDIDGLEGLKQLSAIPEIIDVADFERTCSKRDIKKAVFVDLGNLGNFKRWCIANRDFSKGYANSSMKADSWSGTATWNTYEELLTEGDEEVMKKIKTDTQKEIAELGKKYKEEIRGYKFDVVGDFFDIGLVLTGVPEAWLEPDVTPEEVVRVSININGAFSAGVNTKTIVKSASRILSMVKILEDHGVEVCIKMVNANYCVDEAYDMALTTLVNIKDYDEPINYKKVSALLTPAHHRRGVFKVIECATDGKVASGYGSPTPPKGLIALDDKKAIDALEQKLFKRS